MAGLLDLARLEHQPCLPHHSEGEGGHHWGMLALIGRLTLGTKLLHTVFFSANPAKVWALSGTEMAAGKS